LCKIIGKCFKPKPVNAPFGRYLRDAKAYEIAGGSNEILKNTIGKEIKKSFALIN
jgi:alkylation response protein AidB-like acyl-CoA dehydrogenase